MELNSADSVLLVRLRGIGPTFATRILKYRELIGGFVDISQLLEVYGIDSILFNSLKENIVIDSSFVKKLDINKLTKEELSKHPYLTYNVANSIASYRQIHGEFKTLTDLLDIYSIDQALLDKMYPYLQVE